MEAVAVIAVISVVLLIVGFKPITLAMLTAGLIALGSVLRVFWHKNAPCTFTAG